MGSNPTEGKICFSQFTPFYEVECEKLFCKTNIKLKFIKLIKKKLFKHLDDININEFIKMLYNLIRFLFSKSFVSRTMI